MSSAKKPIHEGSEEFLKHAETTGRHTQARFRCYISESQRYEGAVESCVEDVDGVLPWGVIQRVDVLVEEENLKEKEEGEHNGCGDDGFPESLEDVDDIDSDPAISCSICRDGDFIVPRITKCGHVFCYLCIAQYLLRDELTGKLIIDGQARLEAGTEKNNGGGGASSSSSSGAAASSGSAGGGGASSSSSGAGGGSSSASGSAFNALVYSAASFGADVGTGFIDTAEQALVSDQFRAGGGAPGTPANSQNDKDVCANSQNANLGASASSSASGQARSGRASTASATGTTDATAAVANLTKNSLSKNLSPADRKGCTAAGLSADLTNSAFTSPFLTASSRLHMTRLRNCPVCNTKICLGDLRSVKFQKVLKTPAPSSFYLVYKDPQRLGISVMAPHATRDQRPHADRSLALSDRHTFTVSDHARLRSLPREGVDFGWYFARIVLMSDAHLQRMRVKELLEIVNMAMNRVQDPSNYIYASKIHQNSLNIPALLNLAFRIRVNPDGIIGDLTMLPFLDYIIEKELEYFHQTREQFLRRHCEVREEGVNQELLDDTKKDDPIGDAISGALDDQRSSKSTPSNATTPFDNRPSAPGTAWDVAPKAKPVKLNDLDDNDADPWAGIERTKKEEEQRRKKKEKEQAERDRRLQSSLNSPSSPSGSKDSSPLLQPSAWDQKAIEKRLDPGDAGPESLTKKSKISSNPFPKSKPSSSSARKNPLERFDKETLKGLTPFQIDMLELEFELEEQQEFSKLLEGIKYSKRDYTVKIPKMEVADFKVLADRLRMEVQNVKQISDGKGEESKEDKEESVKAVEKKSDNRGADDWFAEKDSSSLPASSSASSTMTTSTSNSTNGSSTSITTASLRNNFSGKCSANGQYFYQSWDARPLFLSPLFTRILVEEWGERNLPPVINVDVEGSSMLNTMMNSYKSAGGAGENYAKKNVSNKNGAGKNKSKSGAFLKITHTESVTVTERTRKHRSNFGGNAASSEEHLYQPDYSSVCKILPLWQDIAVVEAKLPQKGGGNKGNGKGNGKGQASSGKGRKKGGKRNENEGDDPNVQNDDTPADPTNGNGNGNSPDPIPGLISYKTYQKFSSELQSLNFMRNQERKRQKKDETYAHKKAANAEYEFYEELLRENEEYNNTGTAGGKKQNYDKNKKKQQNRKEFNVNEELSIPLSMAGQIKGDCLTDEQFAQLLSMQEKEAAAASADRNRNANRVNDDAPVEGKNDDGKDGGRDSKGGGKSNPKIPNTNSAKAGGFQISFAERMKMQNQKADEQREKEEVNAHFFPSLGDAVKKTTVPGGSKKKSQNTPAGGWTAESIFGKKAAAKASEPATSYESSTPLNPLNPNRGSTGSAESKTSGGTEKQEVGKGGGKKKKKQQKVLLNFG